MDPNAQQAAIRAQITLRWQLVDYFEKRPHVDYNQKEEIFDLLRRNGIDATNTQLRRALRKLHYIGAIRCAQPQLPGKDGEYRRRWFILFVRRPETV